MARKVGLKIVGVDLNRASAGTAAIALASRESCYEESSAVESVLDGEPAKVYIHRFPMSALRSESSRAFRCFAHFSIGLGMLERQFLRSVHRNLETPATDIEKVGEIDSGKVGAFTAGTLLPIVPEDEVLESKPNVVLVLPWHLRGAFLAKPRLAGCNLVFPLPRLEVVPAGP